MSHLQRLRRLPLREEAGYSLTELLIAIVIIGILALLAIPRFMGVTSRAKMAEAKTMLSTLHAFQQAHYYEMDRYGPSLDAIGFEQVPLLDEGGTARYVIAIEAADRAAYIATATSTVDFDNDGTFNVWEVTESGVITQRVAD
ncbi:MAG: type IV pilin protein [Bacteroidota bacterium]